MTHVVKISKKGVNVMNTTKGRVPESGEKNPLPHLLYAIALAYLFGAREQVKRYQIEATTLTKRPVLGVYGCLHEASTLFEDLCTVAKYIERYGKTNDQHQLWFDVRNHIRHDIREEFDNENSSRKNSRARRLKLNPGLQTDIGFDPKYIKIGGITITIEQINNYLDWSDKNITEELSQAKAKGYIKS